jgi:hypothetical protein
MIMETCADLSFGLNPQALAVATLLAHRQPDFADYSTELQTWEVSIKTFPWYEGREQGVAFVITQTGLKTALVLVVAECASSDGIFVEEWEQDMVWVYDNGPTPKGRRKALGKIGEKDAYDARWTCGEGQIGKAADRIYKRMARWYQAQKMLATKAQLRALPGGDK